MDYICFVHFEFSFCLYSFTRKLFDVLYETTINIIMIINIRFLINK